MSFQRYPNLKSGAIHIATQPPPSKTSYFTSGDVIRGVVRVKPTTRPHRITIRFRGRSKFAIVRSSGNSSTTYREKILFFSYDLVLFSSATSGQSYDILGMGITADDRVELPFEFTVPETVQLDPPRADGGAAFTAKPGFESKKGYALPPTYLYAGSSCDQVVEYYLEANLFKENKFMADHTVRQNLSLHPPRPDIPDDAEAVGLVQSRQMNLRCQTHRLDPNYDPDEGKWQRFRHRMKKHDPSTPSATFKILAKVPRIADGHSILNSIRLSLVHAEKSDIIPEAPPIYLRQIRIKLTSLIHVRIPHRSFFSDDSDMRDSHTNKFYLVNRRFEGTCPLLYDGMTLRDLAITKRRIDERLPDSPDFTSYGLSVTHTIEVSLKIECAEEKLEVTACRGPITVVSGTRRILEIGIGEEATETAADAVPPPYEPPPYQATA